MEDSGGGIIGILMMLVWLAVVIGIIAGIWKVFTKAGKPGWAALIPIYNIVVLLQIVGRPIWCIVLLLIPIVSIVIAIIVSIDCVARMVAPSPSSVTLAGTFSVAAMS